MKKVVFHCEIIKVAMPTAEHVTIVLEFFSDENRYFVASTKLWALLKLLNEISTLFDKVWD